MFVNRYSQLDRLLHHLAFSSWDIQVSVADLEDRLFASKLKAVNIGPPLFVTALPRSGTTLLLELLESTGEFAAHRYRDMPFVLLPLLWRTFFRRFSTAQEAQERAHKDGMMVSIESPEAFEEIVWRAFWPTRYKAREIKPWSDKTKARFTDFFTRYQHKMIALRQQELPDVHRYLSKNNQNICRLPLIRETCPGAKFLIMLRDPINTARSLLNQHRNFLALHADDAFGKRYMEAIGHYDFGANLKPINFGGWLGEWQNSDALTLDFWLRYWCAVYETIMKDPNKDCIIVSYERLLAAPADNLEKIAAAIELRAPERLIAQAERIFKKSSAIECEPARSPTAARALEIYATLNERLNRAATPC
mgnify:CR=1 FL=1